MTRTTVVDVVQEWRELLARHSTVTCALDRDLGAEHGLGVSEYEVLEHLTEAPDRSARVQQLAGVVHLSQSALSRVIGRLETAGLAERKMCPEDRRGITVRLTPAGERKQAEAEPTHRRVLGELMHSELTVQCTAPKA